MTAGDGSWYVYALAGRGLPARLRVRGHSLRVLSLGAADVVVERQRGRQPPTTAALEDQHAVVLSLAERSDALLPARFGSLVDEAALRTAIEQHAAAISTGLDLVRGRQQMTVRVFGPPDDRRPPDDRSTGTAFLHSLRDRARYVPAEVAAIRGQLGSLAAAERVETGEGGLRVTVFHLVTRGDVETYRRRASVLQSEISVSMSPLRVVVSGPWPAFAFAPDLF
jgi:hypothetical protein